MSLFDAAEGKLSAAQFRQFADDGHYDGAAEPNCRVIVDTETIWLEGEESSSSREQTTLAFLLSEVNPVRGKVVVVKGVSYELGRRISTTDTEAVHLVAR
ncbi:hypothetical protein [Marinobacter nauticus]|uniref:Uncharacterized protein n=1 Tax=Marinobacter nauticus TaxID=2743 RepID=A0A368V3C6_MARNT|nr:hypothetical protein [Marinobacter nauticus]RBP74106.1 hypothetical protein DET64_105232 [Marinobacter nauticus]RCW34855.1 hypothetical protein DET51_105231 [Marinobacter nauticus]